MAHRPIIRPSRSARRRTTLTRAASVVIAVGALLALASSVGSRTPVPQTRIPAAAFRPITPGAASMRSAGLTVAPTLDPSGDAASRMGPGPILEPGLAIVPTGRPVAVVPAAAPFVRLLPPPVVAPPAVAGNGGVLSGWASWYDNGTTAMRLPRGTTVRICGPAACVVRVVDDYGPDASIFPQRIADLTPTDFATVCGCSPSRGTVRVTATIL